jgi:hypothetical protein
VVFDRFSLPDLAAVSRRTALGAVVCGVIGMILCLLFSQPWAALGLGVGLGLGLGNFRMIQRSVVKVGNRADENRRRPLALNTLSRMGLITVLALGLLFVRFPLGFGLLGGLALFQLLLLLNVTRSMLKMGIGGGIGSVLDADSEIVDGSTPALEPVEVPDERGND